MLNAYPIFKLRMLSGIIAIIFSYTPVSFANEVGANKNITNPHSTKKKTSMNPAKQSQQAQRAQFYVSPNMPATYAGSPLPTFNTTKSLTNTSVAYLNSLSRSKETYKFNVDTNPSVCGNVSLDITKPISLNDILQQSICKNPELAQALRGIEENQHSVDLAESTFLPRLTATGEYATNRIPSSNSGAGAPEKSLTGSLNLSWLLFDFGVRSANLEAARQTLSAALATKENATLSTLIDSLRIYTEALTAYGNLNALTEAETIAKKSMNIVQAQYDAKIVGLSEITQAQTALARATLERSQANGLWANSKGQLAIALGLPVQTPLNLADPESLFLSMPTLASAETLLEEAKNMHPRVRAAKAEIASLKQRMLAITNEYYGSLNFNGNAARTQSYLDTGDKFRDNNVGVSVQANIPLFAFKEKAAREGQVQAQINAREDFIQQIQNELSNDVWRNAQEITTTTQNLDAAKQLLEAASKNYDVSLGRYKAGVGTISELLIAQNALSNAQQQLQSTKISHIRSRIQLSMAVGRLSFLKAN